MDLSLVRNDLAAISVRWAAFDAAKIEERLRALESAAPSNAHRIEALEREIERRPR